MHAPITQTLLEPIHLKVVHHYRPNAHVGLGEISTQAQYFIEMTGCGYFKGNIINAKSHTQVTQPHSSTITTGSLVCIDIMLKHWVLLTLVHGVENTVIA